DRLLCKVAHKLNLLVGEGANFLTKDRDGSNQVIILKHRHDNDRANAAKLDGVDDRRNALGIRSCRCKVGGLDRLLGSDQLGKVATRGGRIGPRLRASANPGGTLWLATTRSAPPSWR